jgi:hypothetical protein
VGKQQRRERASVREMIGERERVSHGEGLIHTGGTTAVAAISSGDRRHCSGHRGACRPKEDDDQETGWAKLGLAWKRKRGKRNWAANPIWLKPLFF